MRLLYVIPGLGGGGGAERSLAAMAPVWAEGHDVHIVTFSDRTGLSSALRDAGATLHELGAVSTPRLLRSLVHIARTTRPDLIHTTLFHADVAGRLTAAITGTVVSSSLVNVNYGAAQRTTPGQSPHTLRGARLVDAASAQVVSRFHALSTHVADEMAPLLHVDRSLIDVIPRGRDGAALGRRDSSRRAAVRERLGLPADAPVVGLAARHEWQKGVDRFVDALPALVGTLPDVHVIMAGRDGALSAEIRRRLPEAMPASQLLDLGPRDDVADLMCAADVWCVPSRWEGLGSILVEAMALGVPTVASDIAPIRELAGTPPWIRLVDSGDPRELAAALASAAGSPPPSDAAGRAALGQERFAAGFEARAIAERMVEFFERAAQGPRPGQRLASMRSAKRVNR